MLILKTILDSLKLSAAHRCCNLFQKKEEERRKRRKRKKEERKKEKEGIRKKKEERRRKLSWKSFFPVSVSVQNCKLTTIVGRSPSTKILTSKI